MRWPSHVTSRGDKALFVLLVTIGVIQAALGIAVVVMLLMLGPDSGVNLRCFNTGFIGGQSCIVTEDQ